LVCRSEQSLPEAERRKIALFTNVPEKAVISAVDADSIYRIPVLLYEQGMDELVNQRFGLNLPPADLSEWESFLAGLENLEGEVKVAMVGKYVHLTEAYKSLSEALVHAGVRTGNKVNIHYVDSEQIEKNGASALEMMDAILVPGGFGNRGVEGKIAAVRFARENHIPFLGICLGMQVAVIEFARHVAGLERAHSTEFDRSTPDPVIGLITEWLNADGKVETRSEQSDLGGTMRLGGQQCRLQKGSLSHQLYAKDVIVERHRHRYEFNNSYLDDIVTAGMKVSGRSVDGRLVEIVEIPQHPWFIACQFHPEFTSTPRYGHPLFSGFIEAAKKQQDARS
jgi:CTP synthase